MNIRDFTFEKYDRLLEAAGENGYDVLTVADYLSRDELPERYVVLRHDVDRKVDIARSMAHLEASHDVRSTYYFRTSTFDPEIVTELEDLGHEIGYHYEELARVGGDIEEAYDRFEENLAAFRRHVDVRTACSHGSPLSSHLNLDMWQDDRPPAAFDLLGEAYLSTETDDSDPDELSYCSDTGRHWGMVDPVYGLVETTDDLIELLEVGSCPQLYVLAHPGRWSRNRPEFVERVAWDLAAESGKQAVKPVHSIQQRAGTFSGALARTTARSIMISRQLLSSRK
ncbi:hypothetical protein OB955_15860 [Halobacteria archaeon AArc-m2/3/4]|uniref:Polysaccharide deacetylase n=1 Tax=Natronoglomus mannanivorans TaxID=2979990 RepID=A0ABT2QGZ4_9EURY|nr:hypothetical protein [Halobacteria archaeon AArc-m2/3/4]